MDVQYELFVSAAQYAAARDMTEAEQFFYEHAGFPYSPDQTPEQTSVQGARRLANAEAMARTFDLKFHWEPDHDPCTDLQDDSGQMIPQWVCIMEVEDSVKGSLGGIGFTNGCDPNEDPYSRVVEAELALEYMHEQAS